MESRKAARSKAVASPPLLLSGPIIHSNGPLRKHRLSSAGSKVLSSWFQANKLSINIKRSNFILFKTKQNRQKLDLHFSINDSEVDRINELLFLGVIVDEHLSW